MSLLVSLMLLFPPEVSGWEIFMDTQFRWEYAEEFGMEVEVPIFSESIKALDGKEITVTGHYLPLDLEGNRIIISKLPYAACFFCGGGGGQESVLEILFNNVQPPFRADDLVTIKGKLKLNLDDYEHLAFMITDAKVIQL